MVVGALGNGGADEKKNKFGMGGAGNGEEGF